MLKKIIVAGTFFLALMNGMANAQQHTFQEPGIQYGLPALFRNSEQQVILAWTEKSADGNVSFLWATSADEGKTFGKKNVIFSSPGIGTGRLARPRLLFKKNGEMVAVFSFNPDAKLLAEGEKSAGRPKNSQIHFTTSKDGITWSTPQPIHSDTEPKIRGFFDAALMANDELAVVFLKDIPEKKHERDLRIITTENGILQEERVVDPFVCDCCNLGLLTDAKGNLNIYYRENENDLRDIAKVYSTDFGKTFSKREWVHRDNWEVAACPHNGPQAIAQANTNLIVYYTGKENAAGIRLVNQEGKLLTKIEDETVKTATLVGDSRQAVLLYSALNNEKVPILKYRKVNGEKVGKEINVENSLKGTNPTGIVLGKNMLLTYELSEEGKAIGIRTELIKL
jgi:hypothetical protein